MAGHGKRPARRFPGIEPARSGGRWQWRARCRERGASKQYGPLRESQREAYADLLLMRSGAAVAQGPRGPVHTLREAGEAVVREAIERGLPAETVDRGYRAPLKALGYHLELDAPVRGYTVAHLMLLVDVALEAGYAPSTVSQKWLRFLSQCYRVAGVPDQVPETRRRKSAALQVPAPETVFLAVEELRDVLARIRSSGSRYSSRHRDADVIELVASTGIRSGELSRVRLEDVDLERSIIRIREPKVRSQPREAPVPSNARDPLARLVERARARGLDVLFPGGMSTLRRVCRTWARRLDEPRLHARALRHSYATALLQSGATLAEVRDLLGHRTLSAVTTRYLHTASHHRARAAERIAGLLSPPADGSAEPPQRDE